MAFDSDLRLFRTSACEEEDLIQQGHLYSKPNTRSPQAIKPRCAMCGHTSPVPERGEIDRGGVGWTKRENDYYELLRVSATHCE